jgi:probable phosphoglycerate mutase
MGWIDEGIDPSEMPAAAAVAKRLLTEGITRIYSSPLQRAKQTAAALATRLGREIETRRELGELQMGVWEGLTQAAIAKRFPDEWKTWRQDPGSLMMPGRETLNELKQRVGRCLDEIATANGANSVAVYTHDTVIRVAVLHVLDLPVSHYRRIEALNCSVSIIEHGHIKKLWLGNPQLA